MHPKLYYWLFQYDFSVPLVHLAATLTRVFPVLNQGWYVPVDDEALETEIFADERD